MATFATPSFGDENKNESRRDDVAKAGQRRLFETQSYVCQYIPQTPGGRLGLTIMSSLRDSHNKCLF